MSLKVKDHMRFHLLLILFLSISSVYGQNKSLEVLGIESIKFNYPKIISSENEAKEIGIEILQELYEAGYLAASIDSVLSDSNRTSIFFSENSRYRWVLLRQGNLSDLEFQAIDFNSKLFLNRPFNPKQLSRFYKKTINYFEERGYPFASIQLDSVLIDSNQGISAAIQLTKNEYYSVDSISIKGNSKINESFLLSHLDIQLNEAYQESDFKNIDIRINEIPFVKQTREKEVQFFEDYVKLIVYLEKKRASRFDGVIGLLTNENDGKIEFTGDVDLNLINAFSRGESLGLNWRKLQGNSQDLKINFAYPYLFNSPIGIEANFKLYRKDTTFIELYNRLGINYNLRRGEYVKLFIENKSSRLLTKDQYVNPLNASLPPFGDVRINLFGVGYQLNRLDYLYNPQKGISLYTDFAVGRKKLIKIAALEELQADIYEDIDLTTNQFNGNLAISYFIPLGRKSTVLVANKSASTYSENIYQNELLRIGGLKILRGFDEESITASTYSIFSLEYRFLLDRNSFFSVFSDGGYYEANTVGDYYNDTPLGIGAGISFETNAGIFTFNYAVGKQFDNPIDLRAAKIHFGFINFF
tara:strand:- start:6981 stop:8735 length:1755 start_codon:yes stop_codon:yes gene_type:complete